MRKATALKTVKAVHTVAWAFFAGCILAIPVAAGQGAFRLAFGLIAIVCVEVAILLLNGMRCPLTKVASRYTDERHDNFDIYLPLWLARYNKHIFGSIFAAAVLFTLVRWLQS
jgi:hypothetical protein